MNTLFSEHEKDYIEQTTGLGHNMIVVPNWPKTKTKIVKQAYRVVADYVGVVGDKIYEEPKNWLIDPSEVESDEKVPKRKYFKWYASEPRG